jgi:hypothetical protein
MKAAAGLLAGALLAGHAHAQTPSAPPTAPACPAPAEVSAVHLYGLWRAEQDGSWHAGTLLLEKHPEYAQSVRGAINRNGERSQVAGDVEAGAFTLEESADGKRIAATWLGDVVPGSCGREIRGTWQAEGDPRARRFVLRKVDP